MENPKSLLPQEINLLPHQDGHVQNIWKLIVEEGVFSFIDTSSTGRGKTITTLFLALEMQKKYGTKIMVVAPSDASLNNDDGWLANAKKYGVDIHATTTYPALRGGQGKVSHPWLIPDKDNKKKWTATKEFEKLCANHGLFLIFDEFHHCKNSSISHFACAALVKTAKKYRKYCRVALLSHTPGDKKEHYPQILRMTGLISSTKMFKHVPFTRDFEIENYGLGELAKVCIKLSPKDKKDINGMMYNMSKNKSFNICKELFDKYISPIITFAMPEPEENKQYNSTMLNAFLETDEESLHILEDGINILSGAVNWNGANVGDANTWNLANIGNGLKMIERGKLLSMARYVREEVQKNPNKKFVICCGSRSNEHQEILKQILYRKSTPEDYKDILVELKDKNPNWRKLPKDMINYICRFLNDKVKATVLNGKTDKKERVKIIRNFQEDNNKTWCLIISPGVGSESISLHDKIGNRPREMLIVPDFMYSKIIQATGRVVRTGMKSDAKVMIVYSKEANLETNILDSMIRKTKVARDLMAKDQEVVFPGEFPFYIEGQKDVDLEFRLNVLYNR